VHRLDKDTSGVLIVAKNNKSHLLITKQFAKHAVRKKYIALVKGKMEFNENIIDMPVGRHPLKRENMSVNSGINAKYAKTYYKTLKRWKDCSLVELHPFTGRTHQLRVHLAFIGHPILGDIKYGNNNQFSRMALHAQSIGFIHPETGKEVEFSAEIPAEFDDFMRDKDAIKRI
jgi:23S rRNA pseudouridine1911/1915/1917 synthase